MSAKAKAKQAEAAGAAAAAAAGDGAVAPHRNPVIPGDVEMLGSDVEPAEPMDLRSEDDGTPSKKAKAAGMMPDADTTAAAAGAGGLEEGKSDAGGGDGGDGAAVAEAEQLMLRFVVGMPECAVCLAGLEAAVDRHAEVKEALESERQALNNLLVGDKMQQQLELGECYYLVPK
jgi:hypothetical protein